VAAVLTDELTRVSVAEIEKWDEGPDGTVYVYGRCTTPEVDTDEQVVDSGWSGPALKEYLATAPTVRVQHNAQRDPAGSAVRVDVNRDGDGAHWLKAAVDEPIAQRLVKKGHLRAFSVGISRPVIERDVTGKARGGVIKGGKIVEVSLVDSPANRSCFLEIAKSAADGTCEFTGKVGGSDDFLAKALDDDLLTKTAAAPANASRFGFAEDLSVTFTPNDLARLMKQKFVQQHYDELAAKAAAEAQEDVALKAVMDAEGAVYKRDIDTATRRRLAADGKALPNLSYPIENAGDLSNAATLARSGHGDVAAARRLIARRARELGVANPLDESDEVKKGLEAVAQFGADVEAAHDQAGAQKAVDQLAENLDAALKEAEPDVTKDPEPEPEPKDKPVKKAKKPKKMPPWLNKPKDDDGDDGDDKDDDSSCKSVSDHLWAASVTWSPDGPVNEVFCSKCHTTPAAAAGVTTAPMDPAPVGELMESTLPAALKSDVPAEEDADSVKFAADLAPDPEVAALLRFKMAGADEDLGRLHDLTCPAYHPETVGKYHPYADLGALIDSRAWQRKTLAAAAGPLEQSLKMQEAWEAAYLLKTAAPADVNQWRLEAFKAFRDANPGPATYPTPGSISPQSYNRPVLTDGRAADAVDYAGPNSGPQVASGPPNAMSFDRPPLSAGHQSPSPSHMKGDGEYPDRQGVPTQLSYAQMQKEHQRMALVRMHSHLSRQFPEVCPLNTVNAQGVEDGPLRGVQPEGHPVPPIAGIGKAIDPEPAPAQAAPAAAAFKAEPEDGADMFADADVYKGFKKMRKKLGKKVLSGKMTVDEARARMGRTFAQKGEGETAGEPAETVQKSAQVTDRHVLQPLTVDMSATADLFKTAVAEALAPVAAELSSTKALLAEQQETFTTKLAEQQKVIDAIADQPDPSTAAFSGLAFNPVQKTRRPAAVPDQAEYAARAQEMVRRNLQSTYSTHSNPYVREAAGEALAKLGVPEVAS